MARVFQDTREKREMGARAAPWYVEWREGDRRHSRKIGGKMEAKEVAKKLDSDERVHGFAMPVKKTWDEFVEAYTTTILPSKRPATKRESILALSRFKDRLGIRCMSDIDGASFKDYLAKRLIETTAAGTPTHKATAMKELRGVRAALSYAAEKKWIRDIPKMPPRRDEGEFIKRFVTDEHHALLIQACDIADCPDVSGQNYSAADWWKAMFTLLWYVPLRIEAMLALHWNHVFLDDGRLMSLSRDNKQKKGQWAFFPPAVAELLKRIRGFDATGKVFPWPKKKSALYRQFHAIQEAAGFTLELPCYCDVPCGPSDRHFYGFHDFRRSFAVHNRDLPAKVVQGQMGHSDYTTTLLYDQYGKDQVSYASRLHTPRVLTDTCKLRVNGVDGEQEKAV